MHPLFNRAIGYCRLADELRGSDPHRALALLEEARDRPVRDGADLDLDARIKDVEEKLEKMKTPGS